MLMRWAGFTGTRFVPPSEMAKLISEEVIQGLGDYSAFVTGGCRGFDAFIGALLMMTYPEKHHYVVLPSDHSQVERWWEWPSVAGLVQSGVNFFTYQMDPGTSYKERNEQIVRVSHALFVFADHPEDDPSSKRSGTWMTKRIAERLDVPIGWVIIANPS